MSHSIRLMVDEVAAVTGVPREYIMSAQRTAPVSRARAIAAYVIREVTLWSWARIGRNLDKDHTTIIAAYRKIAVARRNDEQLDLLVSSLIDKLVAQHRSQFSTHMLDVVDIATPIAGGSLRGAIGTSARNVQRLAEGVLELWDIALAAEYYVHHIEQTHAARAEDHDLAQALGRAITETVDELRNAPQPEALKETA